MSELTRFISRLSKGIARKAPYVATIRYPQLLVKSLKELNEVIGNEKVKDAVAAQINHLIVTKHRMQQGVGIKEDKVMLNTLLYGPPGVGKTSIGIKLAKIWYSLGYLETPQRDTSYSFRDLFKDSNDSSTPTTTSDDNLLALYVMLLFVFVFLVVLYLGWSFYAYFGGVWTAIVVAALLLVILGTCYYISRSFNTSTSSSKSSTADTPAMRTGDRPRPQPSDPELINDDDIIKVVSKTDLTDKWVGWSDKKTKKLLEDNLGRVVFIDEAYTLGSDMHDSFGIEALNTINQFLSEHPNEIIVIFAGYQDLMEAGPFSFQPGLRRRFMWQFDCSGYTVEQLFGIFKTQLAKTNWGLVDPDACLELFRQQSPAVFADYGGSTERLAFYAKTEHSRDYIAHSESMSLSKLSTEHVRKGLIKLRENTLKASNKPSANPLVNMMNMLRGKPMSDESSLYQESEALSPLQEPTKRRYTYSDRSEAEDLNIINQVRAAACSRAAAHKVR